MNFLLLAAIFALLPSLSISGDAEKPLSIEKRKVAADWRNRLWPSRTVKYGFLETTFNKKQREILESAMDEWSKHTCVKFERVNTTRSHFVFINSRAKGCFSNIGYIGNVMMRASMFSVSSRLQVQNLNLSPEAGCLEERVVLHELGHTLGLIHEHSRPDRDDYITIYPHNIPDDRLDQLDKVAGETFGLPYDFQSIMHYSPRYFAKEDTYSFRTKQTDRMNDVFEDNSKGLSFTDVAAVNIIYKCGAHCRGVVCPKPGFVNKNCKCVTPWDFAKENCYNEWGDARCAQQIISVDRCYRTVMLRKYSRPIRMIVGWIGRNCRKFCERCYRFIPEEWSEFPNVPSAESITNSTATIDFTTSAPATPDEELTSTTPSSQVVPAPSPTPHISGCVDLMTERTCSHYAIGNLCRARYLFMKVYCKKSCFLLYENTPMAQNFCNKKQLERPKTPVAANCKNIYTDSSCDLLSRLRFCNQRKTYQQMKTYCRKTCYVLLTKAKADIASMYCDKPDGRPAPTEPTTPAPPPIPTNCQDDPMLSDMCDSFAEEPGNWCDLNKTFMKRKCKRTCFVQKYDSYWCS